MTDRHTIIVSMASNCDQEKNLSEARKRLAEVLLHIDYTDSLWTEPISSKRKDLYLNQLAKGESPFDYPTLSRLLKNIEHTMGRTQEDRRQGIVRIDLDILQYDGERYHDRDWDRPYVTLLIDQL